MMANQPPLLPDVGILALTYHHWGSHWMTPHHVLTRLAQYFHVVWVNPAHEKEAIWKDRGLSFVQLTNDALPPGFHVYTPELWLPKLYRPTWLANLTFDQRLKRARQLLENYGCKKIILYFWFPEFMRALKSIPFDFSCYHIDDEYSFSETELPVDETESRLIAAVDQVFVISPGLLEKKGGINRHTAFAPEGVDYQAYANIAPEPADLAHIPHPRIGYTGKLKKQLDWSLLLSLVQQHPEWSFVFVGPRSPHPDIYDLLEQLSKQSNVHFLGAKSVQELTVYPQYFDVCIMPYLANGYTKYIYPLKLHEYLASGQPVVGTHIRSLEEFAGVLSLARTHEEWITAIKAALKPSSRSPEQRTARQMVAQQYDWQVLVKRVAETMVLRLGQEFSDRFAKKFVETAPEAKSFHPQAGLSIKSYARSYPG